MVNRGLYVEPWSRQKLLQKKYSYEEVPDLDELVRLIDGIKIGEIEPMFQTMRAKALVAMYYLTACRASELVKCTKLRKQQIRKKTIITKDGRKQVVYGLGKDKKIIIEKWEEKHDYLGIRRKHIHLKKIDDKLCLLIRTENRKNKDRLTKRQPIPISLERPIADYIVAYMRKIKPNDLLFKFGVSRATQIINDVTGFNLHFIRHIRATHLVTKYDFNEQMLIKFMGWTDGRPAKYYIELKSSDIFRQFYKG